jgi:cyclopropane fatty-acyl-phospholipid synthase-like methyltransferase
LASARAVGIYDNAEGVEQYVSMAEGHDGRAHVEVLGSLIPAGATVLELGMGPGKDFDMMSVTFDVVGSDNSQAFLDRYLTNHPGVELLLLDAVCIETDLTFDAIYSNKVLQHLTIEDLRQSLARQAELVPPGGILMHGIWAGTGDEDYEGLFVQYHTCDSFRALMPSELEMVECSPYAEMDPDDSLRVVLRRLPFDVGAE